MDEDRKKDPLAIVSIILGIASLLIWIFPLLGIAISVSGLILGVRSYRSKKINTALLGIILSAVGLGLSLITLVYGIFLGFRN